MMEVEIPVHKVDFRSSAGAARCGATSAYQMEIKGQWHALCADLTYWEGVTCEGCLETRLDADEARAKLPKEAH